MSVQKGFANKTRLAISTALKWGLTRVMAARYTFIFPQAFRVFSPWYEPEFLRDIFAPVSKITLLTEDRCYLLDRLVRQSALLDGDMAECGVYKGGGALLIARAIAATRSAIGRPAVELLLFDTFEGMPDTTGVDAQVHSAGDFGDTSLEAVAKVMSPFSFATLRQGLIPASLRGLESRRFSFVHIDVDLYRSTLDCLEFFYPRLVLGGILLFDDYGVRIYEHAEKRAVDEFFASRVEKPISLTNGQTLVIKAPPLAA
jgi:O-methyltransferase